MERCVHDVLEERRKNFSKVLEDAILRPNYQLRNAVDDWRDRIAPAIEQFDRDVKGACATLQESLQEKADHAAEQLREIERLRMEREDGLTNML